MKRHVQISCRWQVRGLLEQKQGFETSSFHVRFLVDQVAPYTFQSELSFVRIILPILCTHIPFICHRRYSNLAKRASLCNTFIITLPLNQEPEIKLPQSHLPQQTIFLYGTVVCTYTFTCLYLSRFIYISSDTRNVCQGLTLAKLYFVTIIRASNSITNTVIIATVAVNNSNE